MCQHYITCQSRSLFNYSDSDRSVCVYDQDVFHLSLSVTAASPFISTKNAVHRSLYDVMCGILHTRYRCGGATAMTSTSRAWFWSGGQRAPVNGYRSAGVCYTELTGRWTRGAYLTHAHRQHHYSESHYAESHYIRRCQLEQDCRKRRKTQLNQLHALMISMRVCDAAETHRDAHLNCR